MKRSISFRPTLLALVLATNFPVAHAAVPKDMLVIGKAADPQTLDPAVTIDNNDWTVTYPLKRRTKNAKTFHDKCENFNFRASNETAALTAAFLFIKWDHFG